MFDNVKTVILYMLFVVLFSRHRWNQTFVNLFSRLSCKIFFM